MNEKIYRLDSAKSALDRAEKAYYQTGELGMKRTIMSVDEDEAIVIGWALKEYIKKHSKEN